jgi:hypothetical protein
VRQLCAGQRPEEVARELGHSGTDLIYRHYAPWVKDMDMAHIARIVRTTGLGSSFVTLITNSENLVAG